MKTTAWIVFALLLALLMGVALFCGPRLWALATEPRSDQLAALNSLPMDYVAKARQFRAEMRPSSYASLLLSLAAALLLGLTPLGARLVGLVGTHWLARGVLGGLLLITLGQLVTLPLAAWQENVLRRYGLSTRDWGSWAIDVGKAYVLGVALSVLALAAFYALARFAPRWWWAIGAGGAALLVVLLSFAFPVLVEPVFNKFTPMEPSPLRSTLMELASKNGAPVADVLVADASRRTRAVNAYVSGLGPTRRIVIYDTLLKETPPEEVVSVVAHELGHARFNDVLVGTVLGALGAASGVVGLYLLGGWSGLLRRAGVESVTDPRAIGLILAAAAVVGLVLGPAQNFFSRGIERRADGFALLATGDRRALESMHRRLALVNLSDPDPPRVEYWLFASHPSTVERIAAARNGRTSR